jgi:hypothetical protein
VRVPTGQDFGSEEEPNSAAGTANPIVGTSRVIQANSLPGTDLHFFSFQANAGDRVYAAVMTSLNGRGLFDSELVLFQPDGITALETDNDDGSFGASSSSIAGATIPAAGDLKARLAITDDKALLRFVEAERTLEKSIDSDLSFLDRE